MTGINIAIKVSIFVCVIVISAITSCSGAISDTRLCYDPKCSEPVSIGTTIIKYQSNHPAILSFDINMKVTVYSKSAGNRTDLWGVEINGKRGYAPLRFIREETVLRKNLIHKVPTEGTVVGTDASTETNNVPTENVETEGKSVIEPSQVSPSFEVHDGTTIPMTMIEEPPVPSYSTATPQNDLKVGEHPVLSVHPNIASSGTFKDNENDISMDNEIDAGKYMEQAGLGKDISGDGPSDNSEDKSSEPKAPNSNNSNEPPSEESSNIQKDSNDEKITKNGEVGSENSVPSSPEESQVPNDPSLKSEMSVGHENNTNDVTDNLRQESNNHGNNSGSEQPEAESPAEKDVDRNIEATVAERTVEEKKEDAIGNETSVDIVTEQNADVPVQKKLEEPTTKEMLPGENDEGKIVTEAPVINGEQQVTEQPGVNQEEKTTEKAVEKAKEKVAEKPLENQEEKMAEKSVENEGEKPADQPSGEPVDSNGSEIQTPATSQPAVSESLEPKGISDEQIFNPQNEEKPENASTTNENAELDDSATTKSDAETLTNEPQVENVVSTEGGLPAGVESSDEKSTEEVPSNSNIMNPLFSRLSTLPSMVKDVVGNALSQNHEAQDQIINEKESEERNDENVNKTEQFSDSNEFKDSDQISGSPSEVSTTEEERHSHIGHEKIVNTVDNNTDRENEINKNDSTADNVDTTHNVVIDNPAQPGIYKQDELSGSGQVNYAVDETPSFNGFPANRNLLNVGSSLQPDDHKSVADSSQTLHTENPLDSKKDEKENSVYEQLPKEDVPETVDTLNNNSTAEQDIVTENTDSCLVDSTCQKPEGLDENHSFVQDEGETAEKEVGIMDAVSIGRNYWETLTYLLVTAITTLLFSLGYYWIENTRRDSQYIAKINQLEKQLLVCGKECSQLDEALKSTKTKLDSIEDESFGSNEMVASLKADLEASKTAKSELEDQVAILEKELESATEAGLELERMLREILTTNNEDNPLAQSVEDLQTRLNAQQAANEALTNALNLKAQENEALSAELKASSLKSEQLEVEVTRLTEELKHQYILKNNLEQTLSEKVASLEKQVKDITAERINLRQQLKGKEMELKDLLDVVNQMNINDLDFDKLYNVSKVKAEASQLLEERDDLKMKLTEVEGAHQLLEEHVKLINEEVASLSEQCKLAEKAKRDAETRVEVLSIYFKEKEAQRQKEEAVWLEKQGEVSSTVERLHAMQNEIHNYKQQIEMLKREILDQEREYKNQISTLETKSHENWVLARQNERRLEESKAEAGQLRNRLTLIEKNLNDTDPEAKLHRLEANGETPTSPQLYMGAEASSSPIMFSASSGVPLPPPPSYLYGPPVPPFMPPPPHSSGMASYDVGQRPPPLGGRLSSPPPLPPVNPGRYDNTRSPPPPPIIQSYGPHRAFPPFPNDRIHPPPPPPPHSSHLPPPLPPLGNSSSHSWGDEAIPPPPLRNSGFQPHQRQSQHHHLHDPPPPHHHHRDNQQRSRNHKGSLHSSGESLDKNL